MTIISEQGEKDHDNLAGWRRRLKSRVEIIVIKEGGKVDSIKLSGCTNSIPYARHYNPRFVYFLPTF
jgi:hypothetical protein